MLCMRTTLDLDDRLFREAKAKALERGQTLTRFLEESLRAHLREGRKQRAPFEFRPVIKNGVPVPGVDFEDRDVLYERMEGRA